jgi:iron complex transport system substrate-binding protein
MVRARPDPRFALPCIVLLFACLMAACFRPGPDAQEQSHGLETVDYTDGVGRHIVLPRHPTRIISLAPSVTEVVYMLGSEVRLIGVTTQCDWPEAARKKPKIGTLLNPNFEFILASRPDLIIASTAGNDQAAVQKLDQLGLPVFVTAPRSVESIFETTLAIGRITDRAAEGERLVSEMKSRLQKLRDRLAGIPPTRAFFITWFDPLLTPGRKTFETDLLRLANVTSISASSDEFYPRYSLEQVLAQNPEVILTVNHPGKPLPDLHRVAGWSSLDAVRRNRVYLLSEIFQHPSPRFVDGVEELASKLYPERFR